MRLNWGTAPVGAFEIFELCLVLLCVAIAFLRPRFGSEWASRVESRIRKLARRPWLCALLLFAFPLVMRGLLLPVYGAPQPFISDEYAYLLQADTFASGRVTNPSPPFAERFASVYVLAKPTYTAEYQPAQGATLAAGQVLTGSPWAGVVLSMAMLCAITYWALLGWLPRTWAFVGTAIVQDIELAVLSYWTNSYWGGAVPAIGGALMLGALIRLRDRHRVRHAFITGLGLAVLLNSRPLEGVFLSLVLVAALAHWTVRSKQLSWGALMKQVVPVLAITALATAGFAAYYNRQVTGTTTGFPYLLYRDAYGLPQGFFWQRPVVKETAGMPADVRAEYEDQLRQHERRRSVKALIGATGGKLRRFWEFYIGIPLTLTLVFVPFIWRRPGMGLSLGALTAVLIFDNLLFFAYFPHYSAAVLVLIVLVITQSIRSMRESGPAGLFLSRALPVVCAIGLAVPVAGRLLEGAIPGHVTAVKRLWQSEFLHDVAREKFVPRLKQEAGHQLVLVRYAPYDGEKKPEWIFNGADIEHEQIVWARDSTDEAANRKLLKHFAGRRIWLAEPDAVPPHLTPYLPASHADGL